MNKQLTLDGLDKLIQKDFKKNSNKMRYTAILKIAGVEYKLESQYTKNLERSTLLKKSEAVEIDTSDADLDSFMDFLLDDGDIDEEITEEPLEPDTNLAVKIWKEKYSKKNSTFEYDSDDDENFYDTDEAIDKEVGVVRDGSIRIYETPNADKSKAYYTGEWRVLFDYMRYKPKQYNYNDMSVAIQSGKIGDINILMQQLEELYNHPTEYNDKNEPVINSYEVDPINKCIRIAQKQSRVECKQTFIATGLDNKKTGENLFVDFSILINKIFNFPKDKKFLASSLTYPVNNDFHTANVYTVEQETLKSVQDGQLRNVRYEYKDEKKDIQVDIDINLTKNGLGSIGYTYFDGVPYLLEEINTKANKEIERFRKNSFNKAVVFPNPMIFKTHYKLNLGFMDDPDREYEILDTTNKLIDYAEKNLFPADRLFYDAETFGLNTYKWYSKPDLVVTHAFSYEPKKACIIPIRMRYMQNVPLGEALEIVKPLLETKQICAHNGAADTRFNLPDGIYMNLTEDTMHLIRFIIPFITKASATKHKDGVLKRSLDDLLHKAFGWSKLDLDKLVFAPAGIDFDFSLLPEDYLYWYGCPDVDTLARLFYGLRPKLAPELEHGYRQVVTYSRDMAILSTYSGIGVNVEGMTRVRENAIKIASNVKNMIYKITGESEHSLPLQSASKLSNYVFGKLGAPVEKAKKTDKGALSADKHVMKELASITRKIPNTLFKRDIVDETGTVIAKAEDLNKCEYPFCKLHRIWADVNKDITAFYNRLLNNTLEGVYYEHYRPAQTDTYRDTGAIQITKGNVKAYLGAYNVHFGFCSMDYNTEEFRITVNRSTDINLIKMLQDPESDAHTMVAALLYNLPPSEIDKALRDPIKSCNFGIIYGMKVLSLTKSIKKTEHPTEEDIAEVSELYYKYLYKYEEMLAPLEEARAHVRQHGWLMNDLGYRMIYPQVIDVDDYIEQVFDFTNPTPPIPKLDPIKRYENMSAIMNRSGNYPIQSLAAAQLKDAVIRLHNEIERANMLEYIFVPLSVHDEVGLIYDKRKVNPYWLFYILHKCFYSEMEYLNKPKDLIAPLYIGVGFGTTWKNAKSDLAEFPVGFQLVVLDEIREGRIPPITADEDHAEHFSKRIKHYMLNRISKQFQDMVDKRHFLKNRMIFEINESVFIGKKMHELFQTNLEIEDPVTGAKKLVLNIDEYIRLILEFNHLTIDDVVVEDGPVITKDKDKDSGKVDLYEFRDTTIHPLIRDDKDWLTIDARNIQKTVIPNIAQYFINLHNPKRDYHNHRVRFQVSNLEYVELKDVLILELPITIQEDIDNILRGSDVCKTNSLASKIYKLETPPILYDHQNKYIILDISVLQQMNWTTQDLTNFMNSNSNLPTTNSYRYLYRQDDKYNYTNSYCDNTLQVDENMRSKCRTKGFIY